MNTGRRRLGFPLIFLVFVSVVIVCPVPSPSTKWICAGTLWSYFSNPRVSEFVLKDLNVCSWKNICIDIPYFWLCSVCSLLKHNAECHVTYNKGSAGVMLTMWRDRVTIVAVETQQWIVCCWAARHCQLYVNNECCTTMLLWKICR
jgi:hypothetical protein